MALRNLIRPRRYLRKADLCARYHCVPMTIDRNVKAGRLPPPSTWLAHSPLWLESELDAHDAARAQTPPTAHPDPVVARLQKARRRNTRARRHAEARS
jgi:hypothetical protein